VESQSIVWGDQEMERTKEGVACALYMQYN